MFLNALFGLDTVTAIYLDHIKQNRVKICQCVYPRKNTAPSRSRNERTIYDRIREAVLTCALKLTQAALCRPIYVKKTAITWRRESVALNGESRVFGPRGTADGLLPYSVVVIVTVRRLRVGRNAGDEVTPRVARRTTCTRPRQPHYYRHKINYQRCTPGSAPGTPSRWTRLVSASTVVWDTTQPTRRSGSVSQRTTTQWRHSLLRCDGIDMPPYDPSCANMTSSIKLPN